MVLLCATFLATLLILGGTLLSAMSKRRKAGGMTFGLYLFAGALLAISNIAWAVMSDGAFKNLGRTAWYPYPPLGSAYYLHAVGFCLIVISAAIFGKIVLP